MNVQNPDVRDPSLEEFDTRSLLTNAAKQGEQRRYEDFMIIDTDCHHYETDSFNEIFEFIEDPVLKHLAKQSRGAVFAPSGRGGYQEMAGRITRYKGRAKERDSVPATDRDITMTKRWMDSLGVDVACLFPTPMLQLGLHQQQEVETGWARAYNAWLCERVMSREKRIRSMLYLPMNNPEAACKMIEDFGEKPGVVGFLITSVRYKAVYDNAYMRIYSMLEERGLPLAFHAGFNWDDQMLSMANKFITAHALGFSFFNIVNMFNWISNGLPERFPKLKTIWIESGLAWIPFVMQRFDNEYMMRSSECPSLKRRPSDYMREMFYTSQPMEMTGNREALELTFKMINAETQLLYASDYPHWDMDLPSTIYDLPFLSEQGKRNILGGNAQRLFGIETLLSETKQARKAARPAE